MFLYQFHELNHAVAAPFRMAARAAGSVFANPFVPAAYTGLGRTIAALLERVTRRYGKPRFGLDATLRDGHTVAVAEEVVLSRPFCDLLHFRRAASGQDASGQDGRAADPRLLVVAPLSGHHATLLRGTVAALLPDHDVYITDWRDAREVSILHGPYDLDDTIDDIIAMLRHLGPDTHVLAVCQPSVPVLAAVALMAAEDDPAQPASMILMGGPVDTRINPTQVNDLATTRPFAWFERHAIATVPMRYAGRGRRVYPGFLQLSGFMALNLDRHVDAHYQLWRNLVAGDGDQAAQHRDFYDEYLAVMDLPAEYYLQTIRTVFQEHALPRGHDASSRPHGDALVDPAHGAVDGGGREGRYHRSGPDPRGPRSMHQPARNDAPAPCPAQGRPLRPVQRPPLARGDPAPCPRFRQNPRPARRNRRNGGKSRWPN